MARRIESPILNSPFDAPTRHFRFDDEGITSETAEGRRPSSYVVPIPATKKKAGQAAFDTEWTADRVEPDQEINRIRKARDAARSELEGRGWATMTMPDPYTASDEVAKQMAAIKARLG
ncbi:MAG: hypothetical protein KKE89_02990 [Actinobacteria bacterium]|nr:hypothetical protein [Actinomycetota bacterium]